MDKSLSVQDLQSLKKRDPFLYYSIPGVRQATVRRREVDIHKLAQDGLRRECVSCPASIQTNTESEPVAKVKRCTRVSFECPADLLMEDLMEKHMEKFAADDSRLDDLLTDLLELDVEEEE